MKILILAVLLSTSAHGACQITAQVKKASAKTLYVDGVSISKKVREALKSQCSFKVSTMSQAQLIEMAEKNHQKKLKKLRGE